ncbi:MAG: ABC transporter ATP-binding protein [Sumerlaeia bacterium]
MTNLLRRLLPEQGAFPLVAFGRELAPAMAVCVAMEMALRAPLLFYPFFWKWVVDGMSRGATGAGSAAPGWASQVWAVAGLWGLLFLLTAGLTRVWSLRVLATQERAGERLRERLMERLTLRLTPKRGAEMASALTAELRLAEKLASTTAPGLVADGLALIVLLCLLAMLSPSAALIVVGAGLPVAAGIAWANRRLTRRAQDVQSAEARVLALGGELCAARESLACFGGINGALLLAMRAAYRGRYECERTHRRQAEAVRLFCKLLFAALVVGLMLHTFSRLVTGRITLGTALGILEFFLGGVTVLSMALYSHVQGWSYGVAAWSRLMAFLEPAGTEEPNEAPPPQPGANRRSLELDGVWFRYSPDGPDVARDLDLRIAPGEWVAVTGPSGCGKSTLGKLAAGLVLPNRGAVRFEGQGPDPQAACGWPGRVAVALQTPSVFSLTVRENLLAAEPGATGAAMRRALDALGLDSLGLDETLGAERALSGGQLQRLALARLLLGDARLWVLDEPTAALDSYTEALALESLRLHAGNRAVLLITHSPRALALAARRYTMERGRLEPLADRAPPAAAETSPGWLSPLARSEA